MAILQIDTRVITDEEYWNHYLRYNKNDAKKVFNHGFHVYDEENSIFDEMVRWCRANTKGLVYVQQTNIDLINFGYNHVNARFFFAESDDAVLFKLTWCKAG